MIKPKPLHPGETIGVIAPAGPVEPKELSDGIQHLESLGFSTLIGPSVYRSRSYLAGSDQDRINDLVEIYRNPEIKAIMAARGGYGTLRLLPFLDPELFLQNPKIVVGSSDLTFLLFFLLKQCGMISIHGPMVGPNFGRKTSSKTDEFFLKVVSSVSEGDSLVYPPVQVLKRGNAEGVLTGGCLSMVCASIGTPFEVDTKGTILFLEDIDERPYRIDRMLTYLKIAGKLEGVKGIIFGTMEKCHPLQDEPYTLIDVLKDCLSDFEGPILFGFPSGHGDLNLAIPIGVRAYLDGATGELQLLERGVEE